MHATLRRAGKAGEAENTVNLVLAHQKVQSLGVLGDDLVLAVLDVLPIQLACTQTVNTVFLGSLEMVVDFSVEQQCLGWNTADMQASAAQLVFFFNQGCFQTELAGAECGGVSAGTAA